MSNAEQYLDEHGIDSEFAKEFGITWNANELHIPVKDINGNIIFTKTRNLNFTKGGDEPKYKNSAGSSASLFNLHKFKDSPQIIICEGEVDSVKLAQEGIASVASTGGAGTFKDEWVSYFENKEVYLCLDNDEAGKQGSSSILEKIPHAKTIMLPDGIKDVCEYFQQYTISDFLKLKESALSMTALILQNTPPDYSLITTKEISGMEFSEDAWLINKILYSEGFCFIYGAEGTGKSFLTLSIAKAVATGTNWLDKFEVPAIVNVLILDMENPLSLIHKRIKGLGMQELDNIFYMQYPSRFSLSDGKGEATEFAQYLSIMVQDKKIGLIIFDSFVDFMVGNESSSADTQVFFSGLRKLFPDIALLVLHHENKPSQGVFRSDSQRLRGSSNINAQTFTMFRLEQVARSKTDITLKQTKARDELKINKFMLRMNVERLEGNHTMVTGFEYLGDVEESEEDSKIETIKNLVVELVQVHRQVSRMDIASKCSELSISDKTLKRALSELLDSGQISSYKKGKSTWFTTDMYTEDKAIEYLSSDLITED